MFPSWLLLVQKFPPGNHDNHDLLWQQWIQEFINGMQQIFCSAIVSKEIFVLPWIPFMKPCLLVNELICSPQFYFMNS